MTPLQEMKLMAEAGERARMSLTAERDALAAQRDEGLAREAELRKALEDANSLCRSCYQVVERIAITEGDVAFGSAFGRLQESLRGSLERQHRVMFPKEAGPGCADGEKS